MLIVLHGTIAYDLRGFTSNSAPTALPTMPFLVKWSSRLSRGAFKTMRLAKQLWGELAVQSGTFCLLVTSIVLFWRNNALLSALVAAECVMALTLWHERHDVSFFLILAVFGTLAEMAFTHSGVWQYANPTFLGIPLWFPLAFGTAGLAGQRLARSAAKAWEARREALRRKASGFPGS